LKDRSKEVISTCGEIPVHHIDTPLKVRPRSSKGSDVDYLVIAVKEKILISSKSKTIFL